VTVTIRPATAGDADAVCEIHNQGIADRIATLDDRLRSVDEVRAAISARGPRHPIVVADAEGRVVGWASLNQFNPRPVYDHVADFSVYVERGWRGRGIGRRLMEALIDLARGAGYHKMVLATLANNAVGIALYARVGFTHVGVYREHGQLDGRWIDVVIMERMV